jgi:hypothetical protein
MTEQLTPAENRIEAARALNRASGVRPGTDLYRDLVLTAIARTLSETATYLAVLTTYLEPPRIPGLPEGYKLETVQAEKNNRMWGYVMTAPDGRKIRSRFQWGYSETALKQGIRNATADWASTQNGNGREH